MLIRNKKTLGKVTTLAAVAVVSSYIAFSAAIAHADLMIMPIRTYFTDRDRTKTITMINNTDSPGLFRMTFSHQKQRNDGSYDFLEKPLDEKYDMSKMLVFSPRQVELPPRGKQGVRLSVRRPADLPDGEYRVHLKMLRMPTTAQKQENIEKGKQSAMVNINVGFSVPIILRKGTYDTTVSMSDFKITPPGLGKNGKKIPPKVVFKATRKGKYGALGRVKVYWTNGGEEVQVGIANNVSIFPEITERTVSVNLADDNIAGGKFRVVFEGDDADEGKKFDEKTFNG